MSDSTTRHRGRPGRPSRAARTLDRLRREGYSDAEILARVPDDVLWVAIGGWHGMQFLLDQLVAAAREGKPAALDILRDYSALLRVDGYDLPDDLCLP